MENIKFFFLPEGFSFFAMALISIRLLIQKAVSETEGWKGEALTKLRNTPANKKEVSTYDVYGVMIIQEDEICPNTTKVFYVISVMTIILLITWIIINFFSVMAQVLP